MTTLQTLIDMGFSEQRASRALEVTNNKGVEPAMEWLLAHIDEPMDGAASSSAAAPAPPAELVAGGSDDVSPGTETLVLKPDEATATNEEQSAKSIKCTDCNRLFKTQMEVEFHASKSGHVNFSESTEEKRPLTEEEKRDQLTKLEEKLRMKRVEREDREKQDSLEREKMRIKSGKDISEARRKMEEDEMKKLVDLRKREKLDEKVARERVKARIEADKLARKSRMMGGVASPPESAPVPAPVVVPQVPKSPGSTTQYEKTRIQVRLQNGKALTETFNVKEQLAAVRLFVQMNLETPGPFAMMTTFPRKVFVDEDFEKPLDVLGLVPSAVIMVTKA